MVQLRRSQSEDQAPASPEAPWTREAQKVCRALRVDPNRGLSAQAVKERRKRFGPNVLRRVKRRSVLSIAVGQFRNVIAALLAAAAGLAFAFDQTVEGLAIVAVLLLNGLIGFVIEWRAVRSMEALRALGRTEATVLRDGNLQTIAADDLVPGDVVHAQAGDLVAADLRLTEANRLAADESALTGESVPVDKETAPADRDAPPAERANMLHKGTALTRGSGTGVVVATGMDTELGRIASLVEEAGEQDVPLQQRMDRLGRRLVWVTLLIVAAVAGLGVLGGRDLFLVVESAIALAVATVPEGLPIVATIALARGMWRMAERNALVNRLAAVETLGSTTLILADKTGTLTENRMRVVRLLLADREVRLDEDGGRVRFLSESASLDPAEDPVLGRALEVGVLCNNADLPDPGDRDQAPVGDPMEVALLEAGRWAGLERDAVLKDRPEVREVAFDPRRKMMATFHEHEDGELCVAVKGAAEAVLEASARVATAQGPRPLDEDEKDRWREHNRSLAADGLRVLALARRTARDAQEDPYRDLTFLGLCGLHDPPRTAVQPAIDTCQAGGVRVVMATGDQKETALRVGRAVGVVDEANPKIGRLPDKDDLSEEERREVRGAQVFPRATPEDKMRLLRLHQESGEIVAMIGDGINDAPALKQADVGVAMGRRGTQVARQAADVVLRDDAFETVVTAVRWGRVIFGNIRRFVTYLMSIHVGEILVVGLAALGGTPLPILPLQILFLNLVTDVFPALALGVGEGEGDAMKRPPRDPQEPILAGRHWRGIAVYGALMVPFVLGALFLGLWHLGMDEERAVTVSFLTLGFCQLWHVFNQREPRAPRLRNEITRNPWVWASVVLCVGLLLSTVYAPGLAGLLRTRHPGAAGWTLILGASLGYLAAGQAVLEVRRRLGWLGGRSQCRPGR